MTIEQLTIKVLSKLGNYDRGSVAAEDQENVVDAYAAVYNILLDDGLVTWAIADTDIPDRFASSLKSLITAELADDYQFREPAIGWQKYKDNAIKVIRRQLASGQPVVPVIAEYF
jgi:hypothetical protein